MPLPRLQLFEFNDLSSTPRAVRDTVVESLGHTLAWGRILKGVVAPFQAFLAETGAAEVLDLGSGGGEPARILAAEIQRAGGIPPRFVLTDLHPRVEAWQAVKAAMPGVLDYVAQPVDATRIPAHLADGRARMIVNVLHHLPPDLARSVLEDAVRGGRGVFVVEGFERNPLQFANFAVAGLPALLLNPILSPRDRLSKAAISWLTPVGLGVSIWDGLVSTMRVYTEAELRAMVAPFGQGWAWTYGTYRYPPAGKGYWFSGVPTRGPGAP